MQRTLPIIRGKNPRRNLPAATSRKRTESNFLCAFERAYAETISPLGFAGRDLGIEGYGIPDWLWFSWSRNSETNMDGSAVSIEHLASSIKVVAFELKISDWKKAFQQAFRYTYFADTSIIVMPKNGVNRALPYLQKFRDSRIGLWEFDMKSMKIKKHYTPRHTKARSLVAKQQAISSLRGSIKFRKFAKLL